MACILMFKPSLRALVVLISLVFRPTQPFLYTAIPHRFAHGNALQNSPLETTSSSLPSSDWENIGGNYILRPPSDVAVRAVIHFLGGAFVGAAPHVTYRYLLHGFAQQGYLVVTTPYRLGFDYLEVCDSVLECFERAAVPLAMFIISFTIRAYYWDISYSGQVATNNDGVDDVAEAAIPGVRQLYKPGKPKPDKWYAFAFTFAQCVATILRVYAV